MQSHWQEIIGTLFGLFYLYFELKAHKMMFPTGILMSLFYTGVFFYSGFYAFAAINVYFIFAQMFAWKRWCKNTVQETSPLSHIPLKLWLFVIGFAGILFGALWWLLAQFPHESVVAWGDSFITSLSIVALWMLSKGYVEQWILLIVANFVSVFLFYYQQLYFTTILYSIYFIASIYGYFSWKKMLRNTLINHS